MGIYLASSESSPIYTVFVFIQINYEILRREIIILLHFFLIWARVVAFQSEQKNKINWNNLNELFLTSNLTLNRMRLVRTEMSLNNRTIFSVAVQNDETGNILSDKFVNRSFRYHRSSGQWLTEATTTIDTFEHSWFLGSSVITSAPTNYTNSRDLNFLYLIK